MDSNISKAKQNRFWGTTDLDEDEDCFKAYNVQNQNTSVKPNTTQVKPTGTPKSKKSANKSKSSLNAPVIEETNLQQGSFHFSYHSDDDLSALNNSKLETNPVEILNLKSVKDVEIPESTENNFYNLSTPINRSISDVATVPMIPIRMYNPTMNPVMMANYFNLNRPMIHPVNSLNYSQPYMHHNNVFQYGHRNNVNISKPNPAGVNYRPSYLQRLDLVDILFRFILQILRSPEMPSVEQIEHLKRLLDSLLVDTFDKPTTN